MDALDSLQGSSSLESKAERIARYKAERRRELAERYTNLEESSSKYTRSERPREKADTADAGSSAEHQADVSKPKDSDVLSEQGEESKSVMDATPSSKISSAHCDENNQVTRSHQKHR